MRSGTQVEVVAERLDEDGRGVGTVEGIAVHALDLLPGEAALVELEHVSPHRPIAFGAVLARRGPPSPDRVTPACPGYGRCGGCVLQALAYPAQLEAKRRRVADALGREVTAPISAPAPLGYRNRGSYVVGGRAGALVLGAYAPASHVLIDTAGCHVVMPAIAAVVAAARAALDASGLAPYREADRGGALRYVVVRAARDGATLAGLVTVPEAPRAALVAAAEAMRTAVSGLVGVIWVRNPSTSGAVLSDDHEPLLGATTLRERSGEVEVELELGAFTQVSMAAGDRLVADLTARVARPGLRAIDLYSGVGAIAFGLAARGAEVVALERNPRAVAAGRAAAERAGAAVRFVVGEASDLGGALAAEPCDLLVVNPPRRGLDAATRAAIVARAPDQVAYVSCEPTTLARDLVDLEAAGYRVTWLQPYDLMPGAAPIETAVVLDRGLSPDLASDRS